MNQPKKTRNPVEAPAEVIVKCTVANIWTTRGKLLRGQTIMLPSDEADLIKDAMAERNQAKLEA